MVDQAGQLHRLRSIFQLAPVGIGIVDLHGQTVMSNDTLRRMLGYTAEEFASLPWTAYTHPDDVAANLELFTKTQAGEIDDFSVEKRFIRKDGSVLWAHLTSTTVRTADGAADYAIGTVQDITERKRLERELRTAEKHYRLLVERAPAVVYIADVGATARWHYVSPQLEGMLGFTPAEWMADPELWHRQLHPDDRADTVRTEERNAGVGRDGQVGSDSYRMFHRDGSIVWVRDDALLVREPDGALRWHGVLVDVTREKSLEARLSHQATHDPLTGLPNRRLFRRRVGQALHRSAAPGTGVAVMFVDLDHFKTINDSFGHECGDQVIVDAGRRITGSVRDGDTVARLGGDEFALVLEGVTDAEIERLAVRVLEGLQHPPMRLRGLSIQIGASIGITTAAPGETADDLLRNADLAMYQAKQNGRGRSYRYHADLHDQVVRRFRVEERLRAALAADEVGLAYQPVVDLRCGTVVGVEALARWSDSELGVVPPVQFIPVAEHSGLIKPLGRQLLERACLDLARWRAETGSTAFVSVNVSPLQLDEEFPPLVVGIVRAAGLSPSDLVLEVTESAMLDERSVAVLTELRRAGLRIAVDDFGTGYSSLSYLRDLPADIIKIDRHFLRPGPDGPDDHVVLHALIRLMDSLRLTTVCEGVESGQQLANLRTTQCRFGQGYLFAKAGDLAEIGARFELPAWEPALP
jgi:diguanylate cyclase (GGDEF)-like protein/PAS domain S-box-containing protein